MNQNSSNQPNSIELPEPVNTDTSGSHPVSDHGNGNVEFGHVNSQQGVTPQAVPVQPPVDSGMIADDIDLIEKDWVIKAKAIVSQTIHDPSLQAKEIQKMKADYLKKRYNKDLKTDGSK